MKKQEHDTQEEDLRSERSVRAVSVCWIATGLAADEWRGGIGRYQARLCSM